MYNDVIKNYKMKELLLFKKLGLHAHESLLYSALLELGNATIAELVKHTGIQRPIVYKWLPQLEKKQLVCFSPKKRGKIYYAESPERLQQQLQQLNKELEEHLPQLKDRYASSSLQPKIRFFSGGDEIVTTIYEDVLRTCKKGDVFYRYESPKNYKQFDEWLPPEYFQRICKQKEIEKFVITNEKTYRTKKKVMERIERAVPANFDLFQYEITQIIYNDKVAFIDFESKVAWIIESIRFAQFQRQLFKLLFKQL